MHSNFFTGKSVVPFVFGHGLSESAKSNAGNVKNAVDCVISDGKSEPKWLLLLPFPLFTSHNLPLVEHPLRPLLLLETNSPSLQQHLLHRLALNPIRQATPAVLPAIGKHFSHFVFLPHLHHLPVVVLGHRYLHPNI